MFGKQLLLILLPLTFLSWSTSGHTFDFFKKETKQEAEAKKTKKRRLEAQRAEKEIIAIERAISEDELSDFKKCMRLSGLSYCLAEDRYYWDEGKKWQMERSLPD